MEPTLYYHPLASYCWKVLIALYESGARFVPRLVDLGRAEDRDALKALRPACKFPVLQDTARGHVLPESTLLEQRLPGRTWLAGEDFSLADCAALPALFYATILEPLHAEHAQLQAYLERLLQRPSVQRVLHEAQPWFRYFPLVEAMPARFLATRHA